jgi:ankyrin repeat protein
MIFYYQLILQKVLFLLKIKKILNFNDYFLTGFYPIHYCAKYDNVEALKVLFENGALLDAQTNDGFTALHFAAMG